MNDTSSLKQLPIVFIGAGCMGNALAGSLFEAGCFIKQVYSRNQEHARQLAEAVDATYTDRVEDIDTDAALYFLTLTDAALADHLQLFTALAPSKGIFIHTSGSVSMRVFEGHCTRHGVLYPMQTVSRGRTVSFRNVPLFVEGSDSVTQNLLKALATLISDKAQVANSTQRRSLHIAAVFCCNFTNHMYALADELLSKYDLPFDLMLPLIRETARKVEQISPRQAQTGPAIRGDENVMRSHLALLDDEPAMKRIYELLSNHIRTQK